MTKAERTRQYIVEKTSPLFNRKGFYGTSLSDMTEATGLTKGSLYGNFRDKEDIATAAFRYSVSKVKALVNEHLKDVLSCKDQLLALLNFYAEYVFKPPVPGGCPLLNTAVEADDSHASMRRVVTAELMSTVDFIAGLIARGVETGEFRKDCNPRELAYVMFCSVEGAIMFSRVERSREPMDIIVNHCKQLIKQISR